MITVKEMNVVLKTVNKIIAKEDFPIKAKATGKIGTFIELELTFNDGYDCSLLTVPKNFFDKTPEQIAEYCIEQYSEFLVEMY